jgi:hypothetical protein
MREPEAATIRVDRAGDGSFLIPAEDVAASRARYMARQATGGGPTPGNDEYAAVLEQETQFGLSRPDILADWARHHMRQSDLEPYRQDAHSG